MFKFDFFQDESESSAQDSAAQAEQQTNDDYIPGEIQGLSGDDDGFQANNNDDQKKKVIEVDVTQDCRFKIVQDVQSNQAMKTDVEPGKYEGGLKLWECSLDLIRYLNSRRHELQGKSVLELGCGHGLPGIFAAAYGNASKVYFQDLNKEVLERQTMNNVRLNIADKLVLDQSRFISGDWRFMKDLVEQHEVFDVILTAETCYSIEMFEVLHNVLMRFVAKPNGIVLLAGKRYYFGVGGGTTEFCEFVKLKNDFEVELLQTYQDGQSNVRDLVLLRWRQNQ